MCDVMRILLVLAFIYWFYKPIRRCLERVRVKMQMREWKYVLCHAMSCRVVLITDCIPISTLCLLLCTLKTSPGGRVFDEWCLRYNRSVDAQSMHSLWMLITRYYYYYRRRRFQWLKGRSVRYMWLIIPRNLPYIVCMVLFRPQAAPPTAAARLRSVSTPRADPPSHDP